MGKQFVIGEFPAVGEAGVTESYLPDRGASGVASTVRFRFARPPDFTAVIADGVLTAVGAAVPTSEVACSDSGNFKPRKLTFIRNSGGTFSVPFALRANVVQVMTDIVALVETTTDPVVCVKLSGEEYVNIFDELSTNVTPPVAGVPSRIIDTVGTKYNLHSGTIPYLTDATAGSTIFLPVKVETDLLDGSPTILGGTWTTCVGAFSSIYGCGGSQPRSHRRYIATLLTTSVTKPVQLTEVPVRNNVAADIRACGVAIANLASTFCLGYKGESNSRLHKLLP